MIRFKTVLCRNFVSVGDKPIFIQLDKDPTTLVQGKNGSAKSSVFLESLSWALYGRAFRNINKAQLINSINKRDCMVEVEFSIGSRDYKIRRGMRPEIFEIYENGQLIKSEAGLKGYQEHLEKKILRMNHKSFCQIVTIGTATFVPFMQMGQGARREIIEDLLDLQVFSQMNRLLKQRVDNNKSEISDIRYQVDLIDEKVRLQKKFIASLREKDASDKEEIRRKIDETTEQIKSHEATIETNRSRIDALSSSISDLPLITKRRKQYTEALGQLRERTAKLKKEVNFYGENDHCPTCKQDIDHAFKCETVEKKEKKLAEIAGAVAQVETHLNEVDVRSQEIANVQREIAGFQSDTSKVQSTISGLNRYVREMQKEIESKPESFTEDEEEGKLEQLHVDKDVLTTRKEELINQKSMYDIAAVLLKDGGIKSKIIKQYIPIINAAINQYLSVLDLNVQFEIDENFKETIKSRFREEFSYESFSEGEKARINLAVTFAWRTIAKMRNSNNTNLLVLDEIADGGVDSEGIDDLVKILNTLADTHIFIISHRESMVDKFPASIKFEKVRNFSRLVED